MIQRTIIKLLILFLINSCASSYTNLQIIEKSSIQTNQDDIEIFTDPYILCQNERFYAAALENNMTAIGVRIKNKSSKKLSFDPQKFNLSDSVNSIKDSNPEFAYELCKLGEVGYVFWASAYAVIDGIFIPFGAVIGIYNIQKASSSNKKMKKDFSTQHFIFTTVNPGEEIQGVLFFYNKQVNEKFNNWFISFNFFDENNVEYKVNVPFNNDIFNYQQINCY